MAEPLLGWIPPEDRTPEQQAAHAEALEHRVRFTLAPVELAKGEKVILTDFLRRPEVIADIGFEFTGFRQLTGSCVGVSEGNIICVTSAVQRTLTEGATKAFVPWWLFPYGMTRFAEGDRGPGEGAVDSIMGKTLVTGGVFDINQPGLPSFNTDDGMALTKSIELMWSDGARIDQKWKTLAKQYPLGSAATISDTMGIRSSIINGYGILDGCNNYVGNGNIKGSGDSSYAVGHYDGRGGHSTGFVGVYHHPNDGYLYGYWNQWNASTYPKDPAGLPRCAVWLPESEVDKLFRTGGSQGETMALSHLTYIPAQPEVISWFI